jgi:hypothetical protein
MPTQLRRVCGTAIVACKAPRHMGRSWEGENVGTAIQVVDRAGRTPDRLGGALAVGFIVLLLATEVVLSLPDEGAPPATVAALYAKHRAFIIVLQLLGFVASALLAAYAWRLRRADRFVGLAGLLVAICSIGPGLITLVIAFVADPADPAAAGRWNRLEPRSDDLLFVGVLIFSIVVAVRLGRAYKILGAIAVLTGLACLVRLVLELTGTGRGALDAAAPLLFLALVATLAVLSFRGTLTASRN